MDYDLVMVFSSFKIYVAQMCNTSKMMMEEEEIRGAYWSTEVYKCIPRENPESYATIKHTLRETVGRKICLTEVNLCIHKHKNVCITIVNINRLNLWRNIM